MGILVCGMGSITRLARCILCSLHSGITHCVHSIVKALAQHLDFRNAVKVAAREQTTQIGNQFFQFTLGGGDNIRNRFGHGGCSF